MADQSKEEPTAGGILNDFEQLFAEVTEIIKSPSFLSFIEAIKYPNFEPEKMRQILRTKVGVEDIIFLCNIALRLGNNTTRIISSMRCRASRARLVGLKNKLQIKDSAMNDPKAVTLSRVLACFPEWAIRILQEKNPAMKISHEELKLIHEEYPVAARTPVAASVLPFGLTQSEAQNALALLALPSLKLSEVINANSAKWVRKSRKERADTTVEYVRRCFNAQVLSKEERASKAIEFGISERDGDELVLTSAWRAAGAAAAAWLKSNYDFDITNTLDYETFIIVRPDPKISE